MEAGHLDLETLPIENLMRRGPDHLGKAQIVYANHQIQLQTSVLKMRSRSTEQPLQINLMGFPDDENLAMHFSWNGEVYQRLSKNPHLHSASEASLETVASYEIADTQLVADMLQEMCQDAIKNYPQPIETFQQEFAKRLADEFGRLVNAEYAFCLVTPWSIYYGRDPQGRRSLLRGNDKEDVIDAPHSWKLASVAEAETLDEDSLEWKEVAPGLVHEYRFDKGEAKSVPMQTPGLSVEKLSLISSAVSDLPDNTTPSMWRASLELEHWLRQAVQLRVCGSASASTATKPSTHTAVLFSGGIDSVVLAALTLQVISPKEPLRLWNVSFVDQRSDDSEASSNSAPTAKDCVAAKASFDELKQLFPEHNISMETTEVSWEEMTKWEAHIRTLIHPKTTTMDLNIAMALWFASRGKNDKQEKSTTSVNLVEPRVLLVGMGADEHLGGYGRHRKAHERSQKVPTDDSRGRMNNLREELNLDIGRLWERNLGRDDRVFSDHGKEARFPYLDYHVMQFLAQTPLEDICDFTLPPGEGDKRILRLLAMRLGLKTASGMVKRAIQFGSRIAHVSDKRRFGSRRKAQGTSIV